MVGRSSSGQTQTVLGDPRENPFTVQNMIEAQSNLYDDPTTTITATHYYIQFNPSSLKDIFDIGESDFFYVDFPLDREVIQMGDYYQIVPDGSFPTLYAVVDINTELPEVNYTIIADFGGKQFRN